MYSMQNPHGKHAVIVASPGDDGSIATIGQTHDDSNSVPTAQRPMRQKKTMMVRSTSP